MSSHFRVILFPPPLLSLVYVSHIFVRQVLQPALSLLQGSMPLTQNWEGQNLNASPKTWMSISGRRSGTSQRQKSCQWVKCLGFRQTYDLWHAGSGAVLLFSTGRNIFFPSFCIVAQRPGLARNRMGLRWDIGFHDLFIPFFFPSVSTGSITLSSLPLCLNVLSFSPSSVVIQSLASMTSTHVKVNRALSVPPVAFDLPLTGNYRGSVTIAPPSAHIGTAPVLMRLISYDLREGQVLKSWLDLLWRQWCRFLSSIRMKSFFIAWFLVSFLRKISFKLMLNS